VHGSARWVGVNLDEQLTDGCPFQSLTNLG
jgi:hypothetical protein